MADWNRKQLLEISYAIQRCINNSKLTAHQSSALSKVYEMTREGSHNERISIAVAENAKRALCELCAAERLYECDKIGACYFDCELLKANSY